MRILRKTFGIFILLLFFSTCGELDIVLPSSGTYRINALINDDSLDSCSLVKYDDKIRPFFAGSITKDPDVTGLMVYLQNAEGEIVGGKIHYTLRDIENGETDTGPETYYYDYAAGEVRTGDSLPAPEEKVEGKTNAEEENGETAEESIPVQTAKINTGEDWFGEAAPYETTGYKNTDNEETLIHVDDLDENLPFFPLPKNLGRGFYTLIFHVLGGEQVYGENKTLYQAEKSFYYLGDSDFALKDVKMYLPGSLDRTQLIPPGTTVMLEASLEYDDALDPYIIWYNGRKRINEGRLADGAGNILWKTPEQTGFHAVRAEVFPVQAHRDMVGVSRVISLPVSSKASRTSFFSEKYHDSFTGDNSALIHWYQFRGSLQDSKNPVATERALIPMDEKIPRWLPSDNSYGLSIGTGEAYQVPPISFYREDKKEGGGQFLVRFKPISEGPILGFSFRSKFSPEEDAASAELTLKEGNLFLSLSVPGGSAKEIALPGPFSSDSPVAVLVGFYLRENRLEAQLGLEAGLSFQPEPESIDLTVPPSGEVRVKLGVPAADEVRKTGTGQRAENTGASAENGASSESRSLWESTVREYRSGDVYSGYSGYSEYSGRSGALTTASAAADETAGSVPAQMMWGELAVLYLSSPIIVEASDQPPPERDADPGDSAGLTEAVLPAEEKEEGKKEEAEITAAPGRENKEQIPAAPNRNTPEPAAAETIAETITESAAGPADAPAETETSEADEKEPASEQNS
ncbi:MAG: hypothetical protein LBJ90_01330 [Treponema sp.]|nr:hypothetical protein [Treponema sp.]